MERPTTLLVIAGLDPSGGAGLLADAHIACEHGFHIAGVATALTEQNSVECSQVHPIDAEVVSGQLERLLGDVEIDGVKIGMLASGLIAAAVARMLRPLSNRKVPIVVDPVLQATRGARLFAGEAQALAPILEIATVVTPNLDELGALTGRTVTTVEEMREAAEQLRSSGTRAVLAKGGHLRGEPIDLLVDGAGTLAISSRRVEGPTPHGTGCALSSELACRLARGAGLRDAAQTACRHVHQRILSARTVGRGRPFLGRL